MIWGDVYTALCQAFGWTWEYVDESMTLPRFREITEYWIHQPPVHVLVARYLGIPSKSSIKPLTNDQNVGELFAALGVSPQELEAPDV